METEGVKTVVFGIGSAGCKLLDRLAGSAPNAELVALDTEHARLDALVGSIEKIAIGEANKCGTIEEVKIAFRGDLPRIGGILSGAGVAIILVSSDDEKGTCVAEPLSEFCRDRRILAIVVALYASAANSRAHIRALREKSDGLIEIDGSTKENDKDLATASAFERASAQVSVLVTSIISSVSNAGFANLRPDELRVFFHGGLFFVLAHGSGESVEASYKSALASVEGLLGSNKTERALAIVSSQSESELEELKSATQAVEEKMGLESLEWIQVQSDSDRIEVLLLCGVKEIPEAKIEKTPVLTESIAEPESKPPKWTLAKIEVKEPLVEKETEEMPMIGEKPSNAPIEELDEIPMIGGRSTVTKAEKLITKSAAASEQIKEEDLAAELEEADQGGEIQVGTGGYNPEQKKLDIPIQVDDIIERQLKKSPALIGMHNIPLEPPKMLKENPKLLQKGKPPPMPEPVEEEDLDDVANELIGMPTFKGKGQKKIEDYRDNYRRYV